MSRAFTTVCTACQHPVPSLFYEFSKGNIRLTVCENCSRVADPYVELDHTLLAIDLFLNKVALFRHLLFNYEFRDETPASSTARDIHSDAPGAHSQTRQPSRPSARQSAQPGDSSSNLRLRMSRVALLVFLCDVLLGLYPHWLALHAREQLPVDAATGGLRVSYLWKLEGRLWWAQIAQTLMSALFTVAFTTLVVSTWTACFAPGAGGAVSTGRAKCIVRAYCIGSLPKCVCLLLYVWDYSPLFVDPIFLIDFVVFLCTARCVSVLMNEPLWIGALVWFANFFSASACLPTVTV